MSSLARCAVGPLEARTLRVQCSFGHRFLCWLLLPIFSFKLVGSRLSWPHLIDSFNWCIRPTLLFCFPQKIFRISFFFLFAVQFFLHFPCNSLASLHITLHFFTSHHHFFHCNNIASFHIKLHFFHITSPFYACFRYFSNRLRSVNFGRCTGAVADRVSSRPGPRLRPGGASVTVCSVLSSCT